MVVAVHVHSFHAMDGVPQDGWLHFTKYGWLGVEVFFVLSGLVLYLPYAQGRKFELSAYARARLLRIVPGLWFALVVSATLLGMWSWALVRHGLFVNGEANPDLDPIPPSWTLTVEMGFYIVLPALVWLLARRRVYGLIALGTCIALGPLGRELALAGYPMTPIAYVDTFAVGIIAAIVVARFTQLPRWTLLIGVAAFAVGVCLPGITGGEWGTLISAIGPLFGIALATVALAWHRVPRALVWLGTISYGIYLWHWPALLVATELGLYRLPDPAEILLIAAASIALGWASWRLVERPALSLKRKRASHAVAPTRRHQWDA
jgi:peptidoglycan/LPS O-acetylase OafA/YrhL